MADGAADRSPGLRERKKLRTRSTLVDAAAELCLQQGYDNTTVEQIAAAAEVSPRTFSRYFPTKDAVIGAIVVDVAQIVANELARQPAGITVYDAMLRAHMAAIQRDGTGVVRSANFNRMAALIQIVNSSASLAMSNIPFHQDPAGFPTVVETAKRMGLPTDHAAVQLVVETWTVIMNTACRGLGLPGQPPIEPDVIRERMFATYEMFTRTWVPWEPIMTQGGQPPAGAPQA
ncbi:MAG: TetR family transcriptional regulator [Mycobacterium sp.]